MNVGTAHRLRLLGSMPLEYVHHSLIDSMHHLWVFGDVQWGVLREVDFVHICTILDKE